ncbi:transcriptional regulator, MarR family [Kribbella flavida DSM 17836]|uniref:Transcriptional regulator, MarR family n=1 Tax=Kribbella flavida (strain DSM 17836 / JCM 10339 / NBRC 14399) TaxID=479435 RepID=D2PWK7_KRIFD|nr:MarR family transcriptional regulator [Kribbella flavida]ADB33476.1 transcriptional regulator, MarR family [Kribbella flavida DSM 17836]
MTTRKPADGEREELVRLIQTLTAESQRIGHAFAHRHGVHGTDVEALIRVLVGGADGRPLTAGELASELGLTTGSVTSLLDRLERAGHVRRERDERDRRRVNLHYGEAGLALAQQFFTPLGSLHRSVTADFSPAELAVVRRYLAATIEAFRTYREQLDKPLNDLP